MEKHDEELIQQILHQDFRLKKLYQEHVRLDQEVARYERLAMHSATAALQHKALKKQKLQGKDEMMEILNGYKQSEDLAA